ncbi:MAG: hypothetical protein K0Q95_1427 [Bacteroidota bacterium]|jgi:hypothetical protein|nr:hypothetical protein [Bacteroidota bacterium]
MTTELKTKIRQINSFVDEAFDIERLADFHLVLQIGNDGLFAIVYDKEKNKYIAFEYYSFQQIYNPEVVSDLFELARNESKFIDRKYRSVTCSVVNNLSTLVPSALFESDKKKTYLKFNTSLQGDELIMIDEIRNIETKNVYALPFSLKSKLDSYYSKINYHHFSSALIEDLLSQNKNQTKKKLFIHVQASHLETIVIEGKKLIFYNTFNYQTAEDFIYYVLFVCEQLHLNPENIETLLLGEIERTSAIFTLSQKYIRNLKFGERADSAEYSYQLQTFPKHFYFSLFNKYLL